MHHAIITDVRIAESATGEELEPRFGHSCVAVTGGSRSLSSAHDQVFVFTGGSDGSDLWRNGEELKDVRNVFVSFYFWKIYFVNCFALTISCERV